MRKALFSAHDAIKIEADEAMDWVRGKDAELVERFTPMVRAQSVLLDFSAVQRIDAAGLAVLVSLYRAARESGHTFAITNPAARIGEILAVVGLDRILLVVSSDGALPAFESGFERDAA